MSHSPVDPAVPPHVGQVVADPGKPWKAVVASLVALLGLLWANLAGQTDRLGELSWNEWLSILIPTILTFAATYATPNPLTHRSAHH